MSKHGNNIIAVLLAITGILIVYELLFQGPALLIFLTLYTASVYYGKKTYYKTSGKVFFWVGIGLLIITIMNTAAFKFAVITLLIYLVYQWYQSKQEPTYHQVQFEQTIKPDEKMYQKSPWFTNQWFGSQHTKNMAYEWEDINIQAGIGDTVIDLNYTVIPKEPPVIIIRNLVGNIEILVPYGVDVSVQHSLLFGSYDILGSFENNTWNKSIFVQTDDNASNPKVKIFTSMIIGKLEVKRV